MIFFLQCNPIKVIYILHVWHARLLANLSLHKVWIWMQQSNHCGMISMSCNSSVYWYWCMHNYRETRCISSSGLSFPFFSKGIDISYLFLYTQLQPEFYISARILLMACRTTPGAADNLQSCSSGIHSVGNSSSPSSYGQNASNQGEQKSMSVTFPCSVYACAKCTYSSKNNNNKQRFPAHDELGTVTDTA